jgi:tRNA 2-selenouridine synthase
MAVEKIEVEQFIELSELFPVIDVRSDGEYKHAHIPGAFSLPLFVDEERKIVGTIYKQQSREQAIKKGLEYFGPKMKDMVVFVEKILAKQTAEKKQVLVHCWRGGMRSAAVAWLLDIYGFKVYTLVGGYKNYRNWVLTQFEKSWKINILGGFTGSGKTILLHELQNHNEAVIDLEGIAGHRGSAFGRIGLPEQTSVEMFENKLAMALVKIEKSHPEKYIWLEDESQRIGSVSIPTMLWTTMRKSQVYFLDIPFENRLNYLVETYGKLDKHELSEATKRIQKKLGGLETKTALQFLEEDDLLGCFEILLKYYDKLYFKSLQSRALYQKDKIEIEETTKSNGRESKGETIERTLLKNVFSEVVNPIVNAQKVKDAFYGNN